MLESPSSLIWHRNIFNEGSLGRIIFPDVLEGRERSCSVLEKAANKYIRGIRKWSYLEEANIENLGQLLTTTEDRLASWLYEPKSRYLEATKKLLSDTLSDVAIGPEDALMLDIFGGEPQQVLISPTLERIRNEKIRLLLDSLSENQNLIVQLFYGISTFTPKTPENIANECNIGRQSVMRIKTQALRKLRHYSINRELKRFLP